MIIKLDKKFKKDIKRDKNSGKFNDNDFNELKLVMTNLAGDIVLDKKYLTHKLVGNWLGYQECHLKSNWLLIYKASKNQINFADLARTNNYLKNIKISKWVEEEN